MTESIKMLQLDHARILATAFVRSKGRLPESLDELATWLLEFDEHMQEQLRLAVKIFQDHMNICIQSQV
jgi:hypothetical protein